MSIADQIQEVRLEFQSDLESLSSSNGALDGIRIKYLGRKGIVADLFTQMGSVEKDKRPQMGQVLNTLKVEIADQIGGWTFKSVGQGYGNGYCLKILAKWMNLVAKE